MVGRLPILTRRPGVPAQYFTTGHKLASQFQRPEAHSMRHRVRQPSIPHERSDVIHPQRVAPVRASSPGASRFRAAQVRARHRRCARNFGAEGRAGPNTAAAQRTTMPAAPRLAGRRRRQTPSTERLARRVFLRSVGRAGFEAAVGLLVDPGSGFDQRPPSPRTQEPFDCLQPALLPAPLQALLPALLA